MDPAAKAVVSASSLFAQSFVTGVAISAFEPGKAQETKRDVFGSSDDAIRYHVAPLARSDQTARWACPSLLHSNFP